MISEKSTNNFNRPPITDGTLRELINKKITPPLSSERDGIRYWQDRILFSLLSIGVYFGFLVYIPSVILSVIEELWIIAIADTVIYFWALCLYFKRTLRFEVRAYSVIILSYLLGIILLLTIGPFGAGPVWLFFFPVITGLFSNLRLTLASIVINLITIIGLGLAIYFDVLDWRRSAGFPFNSWVIIGINFIFLNTLVAVAIVSVLNGLQRSLLLEKDALSSAESKKLALEESNRRLQKEIDDREKIEAALDRSEKALKRSELLFRDLVNLLPLPYFLVDTDLTINYANFKAVETFKLSRDGSGSLITKNALALIAPEDQSLAEKDFHEMIEQLTSGWEHYTGITETGERFPVEILISTVKINEKLIGAQGIIVDMTERLEHQRLRKEKEIAEKTNKAISEWVDFVVHELRTPLGGLLQFAQLGQKKLSDPAFHYLLEDFKAGLEDTPDSEKPPFPLMERFEEREQRLSKYFDRIHSGGYRLQRILNELLDLSKLETNKMLFNMKNTDLRKVVQEAIDEMEASIDTHHLKLDVLPTRVSTDLVCDPFRIGQVLRNLLNNAIKFSNPGGKITISFKNIIAGPSEISSPYLQTSISDEGTGIPADQLEEVFFKFRQSRKTRLGEGSGLGLPICQHIISAHHGKIWAESQENQGTQIHFLLPYPKTKE